MKLSDAALNLQILRGISLSFASASYMIYNLNKNGARHNSARVIYNVFMSADIFLHKFYIALNRFKIASDFYET